jgi:hypothetical protein
MADEFYDDIPAIGNQVVQDVDKIEKSLGYLKDSFEAICTGWSDTSTTDLHVNDVDADPVFGDVTKHYEAISFSSDTEATVTGLNAAGIYRATLRLHGGTKIGLRFNEDDGSNYDYHYHYSGKIANVSSHTTASGSGGTHVVCTPTLAVYFVTEIIFGTSPSDTTFVVSNIKTSGFSDNQNFYQASAMGFYNGASSMTSVTFLTIAASDGTGAIERIG